MGASTGQISKSRSSQRSTPSKVRRCIACGTKEIKPGRRYCTNECRRQIQWVLSLSKGLLKTFNSRYAAFSFTQEHVILDVLPIWAKNISRFIAPRAPGNKPAEDLKQLILEYGRQWHQMVDNRNSKSHASLCLLTDNHNKKIDPESIKPNCKSRPRLSKFENDCLKVLQLEKDILASSSHIKKIKKAYKRMAKIYHPDVGGDAEKFKKLNAAHKQMLLWTENPQYSTRRALEDCWSYNGYTNRWSPPL